MFWNGFKFIIREFTLCLREFHVYQIIENLSSIFYRLMQANFIFQYPSIRIEWSTFEIVEGEPG